MDDLSSIKSTLEAEYLRFRRIVDEVDFSSLHEMQDAFDNINSKLYDSDKEERERFIRHLAQSMSESLIDRGVGKRRSRIIQQIIIENWIEIVENNETVNIDNVLERTILEWEVLTISLEERIPTSTAKKSLKRIFITVGDLIAGGGLLVFDAAKFLLVTPPPVYMFSSFMAGAVFFKKGIDGIILGRK